MTTTNAKYVTPQLRPESPIKSELHNKKKTNFGKPVYNRRYTRTTEYQAPGTDKPGLSKDAHVPREVFETKHAIPAAKMKKLAELFPTLHMSSIGHEHHDHLVAHVSACIGGDIVTSRFPPGARVLDINGNPTANEGYNTAQSKKKDPVRIDTLVNIESPQDAVRSKVKWGKQLDANGKERYFMMSMSDLFRNEQNIERFKTYTHFVLHHTLYYYDFSEITKILNLVNPDAIIYATMLKHDDSLAEQYFHDGEQVARKIGVKNGGEHIIRQTNVRTGEYYEHVSSARWFRQFSYAERRSGVTGPNGINDQVMGISWSCQEIVPETYMFTIVNCPASVIPQENWSFDAAKAIDPTLQREDHIGVAKQLDPSEQHLTLVGSDDTDLMTKITGHVIVHDETGEAKKILISNVPLYESCKMFMTLKERNPETLKDLIRYAKRMTQPGQLYNSAPKLDVTSSQLSDIVTAAFTADLMHEQSNLISMGKSKTVINAHGKMLRGSGSLRLSDIDSIITSALGVALAVDSIVTDKRPGAAALKLLHNSRRF